MEIVDPHCCGFDVPHSINIKDPIPSTCASARVGRDASRIADEFITHLAGLVESPVRVTLEIEADIPDENLVRTVTKNSRS